MKRIVFALLCALLVLVGCQKSSKIQVADILAEQPLSFDAKIARNQKVYTAQITRDDAGVLTVSVVSESLKVPIVLTADATQSGVATFDYAYFVPIDESPALSLAVLLRQGLLSLSSAEPQVENNHIVVKNGALYAFIDPENEKITEIGLPGITITAL